MKTFTILVQIDPTKEGGASIVTVATLLIAAIVIFTVPGLMIRLTPTMKRPLMRRLPGGHSKERLPCYG